MNSLDTDLELVNVVEGVKDTEDVNTVLLGLLDKVLNSIVGKRGVSNTVGTTEEHLEGDVGNELAHAAKTVPWVLVQETHCDVKGGTAPALQGVEVGKRMAGLLGNVQQVDSSDTSGQQRLVGVTPGGVHEKTSLVGADSLGKGLGALLDKNVSPAGLARLADIDDGTVLARNVGNDDLALELRLAHLALDGRAVDGDVTEVGQQLLGSVLAANEVEQLRSVVDEGGPASTINEGRVGQKTGQEGDVGLDTANTELNEGTEDLSAGDFVGGAVACALDQHGVVEGSDDSTGETVTTIETNTVTTSRAVDLNLAGIGLEGLGGVLSGDTALDGKSAGRDAVLGQAKLRKGSAGGDLNLGGDNVDASNFLGNGVLDLDSGVDLDEVVAVLLVDEELGGTGVAVVDRLGQLDGVGKNGIAGLDGQVLGRGNFDDLLVTALDGAVTLVQVDNVAVVVTKELDLNVLGLVEEALHEDGAVAESRLGLGCGTLEVLLQAVGLADDTHTTSTTTVSGLDNDGEAILVSKGLNLLIGADSTLGTRDDGHTSGDGELSGGDLVAKGVNDIGRGADELQNKEKLLAGGILKKTDFAMNHLQ